MAWPMSSKGGFFCLSQMQTYFPCDSFHSVAQKLSKAKHQPRVQWVSRALLRLPKVGYVWNPPTGCNVTETSRAACQERTMLRIWCDLVNLDLRSLSAALYGFSASGLSCHTRSCELFPRPWRASKIVLRGRHGGACL
jgi:hypothetical protein